MELSSVFKSFLNLNVIIIGDVMIDSYMWGSVTRISPEAPVPVVAVTKREDRLGGAANVALNVQALGAKPILCSIVGDDDNARVFLSLLKKQKLSAEGIIKVKKRPTTVKTRILGSNHQMLRVDEETDEYLSESETKKLTDITLKLIKSEKADVIIFEDYDKGSVNPALICDVIDYARSRGIPVVVDPKKRNFLEYKGATLFKPNLKELKEGLKTDFDHGIEEQLNSAVGAFLKKQNIQSALITLSEKGIYVQGKKVNKLIPAHLRDITDVSGAGDTVVSVAAVALAAGLPLQRIAMLANLAGGLVCEKVGVVPVDPGQLLQEATKLGI
jgi:rfaE bifunctional protein kinase chain/domain